jgi:hypothetical protein
VYNLLTTLCPNYWGVLMDELFHFLVTDPMARIAIVVILWVIIIAIILLVISVVISIFQGRSLKFWQISLGGRTNKKNKKKLDDSELDSVDAYVGHGAHLSRNMSHSAGRKNAVVGSVP